MVYAKVPVSETWGAMEVLKESGQAKEIGVSNFNCQAIRDLLSYCKTPPVRSRPIVWRICRLAVPVAAC